MSRLAEILGVEENEEFMFEGTKYRIHNGNRQYFCCEWRYSASEDLLTRIINHPERIKRPRLWTKEDVEDAKAVKRIIPNRPYRVLRDDDGSIAVLPFGTGRGLKLNRDSFPSLKPGEGELLDEIIGGTE